MEALIFLLVVILVVLLILVIGINSRTAEDRHTLRMISKDLHQLSDEIKRLTKEPVKEKQPEEKKIIPRAEERPVTVPVREVMPPPPAPGPEPVRAVPPPLPVEPEKKNIATPPPVFLEETDERSYAEQTAFKQPVPKRDLERFIGENLANKIGIAVLVLGIAFFVKYAIDKNWINETGRVIIGLVCGGILTGLAHYIRNSYRSFSSVLVGGGLTVFYFTIAFGFHQYHLIGQQAAFGIMVIISAFAVVLSLYYNRQELAILATVGGFITPFLVATGQDNYIALFTYLCILNTGLMVLSWFKRWPAINGIALFFTTFIFSGWLIRRIVFIERLPYAHALFFATLFYILFITMNIINSIRLKRKFAAFDFIIVLSINFLYYAGGLVILSFNGNEHDEGIFTALLGIANLLLMLVFYRNKNIDRNFVALLLGISLTFISLAVPIHFNGNHVVIFWAAESVILLWTYQRSRIAQLRIASLAVAGLMLISLLILWPKVYFYGTQVIPIMANQGFITTLVASLALFAYYALLRRGSDMNQPEETNRLTRQAFLCVALILAYLAGALEIFYQFSTRVPYSEVYVIYLQLWSFAVAILLLRVFRHAAIFPILKFLLTALCLGLYLLCLGANNRVSFELAGQSNSALFTAHWIAAALLLWLLYSLVRFFFGNNNQDWKEYRPAFTWIAAISIVLLLSVELYQVIFWSTGGNEANRTWWQNLYNKAGLTILWSICSFTMIWLGMRYSFRTLRIISLSLFTVTLVKLFLFDIRNIPPGGKIAAFILLGILLLTVSFMYQRLKKIIIDDKNEL